MVPSMLMLSVVLIFIGLPFLSPYILNEGTSANTSKSDLSTKFNIGVPTATTSPTSIMRCSITPVNGAFIIDFS